jgi:hypothetical protein
MLVLLPVEDVGAGFFEGCAVCVPSSELEAQDATGDVTQDCACVCWLCVLGLFGWLGGCLDCAELVIQLAGRGLRLETVGGYLPMTGTSSSSMTVVLALRDMVKAKAGF